MSDQNQFSGHEELGHSDIPRSRKDVERKTTNGVAVAGLILAVISLVLCVFIFANLNETFSNLVVNAIFGGCYGASCPAPMDELLGTILLVFIVFIVFLIAFVVAIAGLTLGIIGCVRSRKIGTGGKRTAIAAIVISVVCVIACIVCAVGFYIFFSGVPSNTFTNFLQ